MSEPTAKKEKMRNYNEDFIMLGFVYVDSNRFNEESQVGAASEIKEFF